VPEPTHAWFCFCPACCARRELRAEGIDLDDLDAQIARRQEQDRDANADARPDESDGGQLLNGP